MRIRNTQLPAAQGDVESMETSGGGGAGAVRTAPLRVDAQRNLEHVLRAAREVFGELGYGAPMEDVARRARVGVGTVYRRFPSKDVLVRRIAEEEIARLIGQAQTALAQEADPWIALTRFLRYAVASGAGRLLPPQVLKVGVEQVSALAPAAGLGESVRASETGSASVDDDRSGPFVAAPNTSGAVAAPSAASVSVVAPMAGPSLTASSAVPTPPGDVAPLASARGAVVASEPMPFGDTGGARALLAITGQLVERARGVGKLRPDVTVADVLLVIATAAPSLPDASHRAAASARVLQILLDGLRSQPDLAESVNAAQEALSVSEAVGVGQPPEPVAAGSITAGAVPFAVAPVAVAPVDSAACP